MSHKEDIGKSLQKFPEKKNRGFFSKAYHRFFRGYSEIAVPGKGGKGTRIERIYTGDYYRQDLDRKNKIPVSYTHLDVYKRQALSAGPGILKTTSSLFFAVFLSMICINS